MDLNPCRQLIPQFDREPAVGAAGLEFVWSPRGATTFSWPAYDLVTTLSLIRP